MGLWGRIFGRERSSGSSESSAEYQVSSGSATFRVKRGVGERNARTVQRMEGAFQDWVDEMKAASKAERASAPKPERVRKATVDESSLEVIDLRGLSSTRLRIRGSFGSVTNRQRQEFGDLTYLLIREPRHREDPNAVPVYGRGRRVGYITAAKAAALAPLLDTMKADAFRVAGEPPDESMRMHVEVPAAVALRAFVRARA